MIKHNLTIAWRNFIRYPGYTLINLLGLTIGLICGFLILLYVTHELSYDRYHDKADQIYRIASSVKLNETEFEGTTIGYPVADALERDYPEVIETVRFRDRGSFLVSYDNRHFKEESVFYVDSTLFNVFSINLIQGDPQTALAAPNTLVISEELVDKYFGEDDPIGKVLTLDNNRDYQVTGVFESMPENSHFQADMFLSMNTLVDANEIFSGWTNFNYQTYIVLAEDNDPSQLEAKFIDMLDKYVGPEIQLYLGVSMEEFAQQGNRIGFYLQPLTDIYLRSNLQEEMGSNNDIKYIYLFSIIGILILIIACINFMNLATARYANRAKEVGIKKTTGAAQYQLIGQFLTESLLISSFALILSWLIVPLLIPGFNVLSAKSFSWQELITPQSILLSIGIATLVGLLAGSYPAFFLATLKPVKILKGSLSSGSKSSLLRSVLVVGQFTATVVLIICTIVVFKQLNFIKARKLGFNKENVLILHDAYILNDRADAFKEEMLQHPGVSHASITGYIPVEFYNNTSSYWSGEKASQENTRVMHNWIVDHDYLPTMGIEIVEGRNFSREYSTDSMAILVNETLVKQFGFDEPLQATLRRVADDEGNFEKYKIVGVFKDFHFRSLRDNINPMLLHLGSNDGLISFRLNTDEVESIREKLEATWNEFAPGYPFEYSFLDERFDRLYRTELRLGRIFAVFASIAILIACLGLLGLSAFAAEQRTKEIGVRKVLGASVSHIAFLMYKEFGRLLIWAVLIGFPLAGYAMYRWLEGFEYRTTVDGVVYGLAGFIVLLIAFATLSYQTLRAAYSKPVDALKYE